MRPNSYSIEHNSQKQGVCGPSKTETATEVGASPDHYLITPGPDPSPISIGLFVMMRIFFKVNSGCIEGNFKSMVG